MSEHQQTQKNMPGMPTWWVVTSRELADLWIGGRAPVLLLLFSILLSVLSFLLATNSELSLIPPKEMVHMTLRAAIVISLFISLIIGADAISGEREKGSLETLLLTPTPRSAIIFGKFLAAISPWPAVMAITYPYGLMLAPDIDFFMFAFVWALIIGSILVLLSAGIGMLMSIRAASNRESIAMSLVVFLFLLLPTQLPGTAQAGALGKLLKRIDPMEACAHFFEKILINNRGVLEMSSFLLSPVMCTGIVLVLLIWVIGPKLQLQGGKQA